MANDNSNNKNIADPIDDDATEEFEVPGGLRRARPPGKPEIEVDEDTYDIEDRVASDGYRADPALENELDSRQKRIDELEFQLAQLESKERGMLEEIRAREDITRTLSAEANAAREELLVAVRELHDSREELEALRPALDKATERAERLDEDNKRLENAAGERDREVGALEQQLDDQERAIHALKTELHELTLASENEAAAGTATIRELEAALQQSREEVAELRADIDGRRAELPDLPRLAPRESEAGDQLSGGESAVPKTAPDAARSKLRDVTDRLRKERTRNKELRRENHRLANVLHKEAGRELERNRDTIAAQSGQIASLLRDAAALRDDNARFEKYADSLRIQLQDQIAIAKTSAAARRKLEAALDKADDRVTEMGAALENALQIEKDLRSSIAEQQERHEAETRQLRFELGAAGETIADQETINSQLASDLSDYREYRQALESELAENERSSSDSIGSLRSDLERACKDVEELESKIRDKDNTIADLMNQLSAHSSVIDIESEAGKRLQPIDGTRRAAGRVGGSDKFARQLIGNVDGRELRFPLFKDRLSIGRTSLNDIQLNMQYVSRRHAVIATDHGATRVIDWGSKNGVYVNRERVTERILKSGDVISIGTTHFRYEEHAKK